ncbi:MAG: FAD-dependent thymidylate synthase [Acidobacteriota bacterium]|nr:FAD-dependent thymidylate synthase [Acidobacteriota bacterium]
MLPDAAPEFTADEARALAPYFTNVDRPVFALINLPETVKGALFARYSRTPKSLRRLFLDEFLENVERGRAQAEEAAGVGVRRAEQLFQKVFNDYGDDSVAQLGGVHLACEDASNILTKQLEWGRLMAYLEQSTRYIPYTDRRGGLWRYHVPAELDGHPLRAQFVETLDRAFEVYASWFERMREHFVARHPKAEEDSDFVYRAAIRAKALDTLRGLLPAATQSSVGIYGTGQAYEALLLRLRASPLEESRAYAAMMLEELRKVIPAFLTRVDVPERGGVWSEYLARVREDAADIAAQVLDGELPDERAEVTLTEFDPEGELKVVAAALYASTDLPDDQLLGVARHLSLDQRASVLSAYAGQRRNRRHRPGRAFERTSYRFDVLTDYGAFRDLQRHRMLTLEWQALTPRHGFALPDAVEEAGGGPDFREVMERSAATWDALMKAGLQAIAPYAVSMAYRVRFYMHMNAREAMHLIELRTAPQGHAAYRRVCQQMHTLIDQKANHHAIASAMRFVDHSQVELERLQSERALERKRLDRA